MTEKHLNIAIVDDDPAIVTALSRALRMENYDITSYADGTSALRAFQIASPDAIVLDLQLPDLDGLEICRRIRRAGDDVAILMLTARDDDLNRILGHVERCQDLPDVLPIGRGRAPGRSAGQYQCQRRARR